jgi:DNA-directed RNA polymerase I subunit RPA2
MGPSATDTYSVMKPDSSNQRTTCSKTHKETCPSFRRGHVPSYPDVQRLRTLSFPHVGSFDYFLEKGLSLGLSDISPFEIDLVDPKLSSSDSKKGENTGTSSSTREVETVKMWVENIHIGKPLKSEMNASFQGSKLTPRECRELGLMYSGPMSGDFCYQVNHRTMDLEQNSFIEVPGKVIRIRKKFGDMPIMVMSKACHLHEKRPEQLVAMKEEVGDRL